MPGRISNSLLVSTLQSSARLLRHGQRSLWSLAALTAATFFGGTAHAQSDPKYGDPPPEPLVVMTWNVEWMFDNDASDNRSDLSKQQSSPTVDYWKWKVSAVAEAIAKCDATIVALQEIEGSQTLADIGKELREKHKLNYRFAFIQGTDNFTEQDVGILQKSGLVNFRRHEQSKTMFNSNEFYNLSKHIVTEFQWAGIKSPLTILNSHFRATAEAEAERTRQARLARFWLESQLAAGQDVIILGDLNSEHLVGDLTGDMEILVGKGSQTPLIDLLGKAPENARTTHLILDKQFDRILVSPSMVEDDPSTKDWVFSNIAVRSELAIRGAGKDGEAHWDGRLKIPTTELDVSDHAPVVATFELR